MNEASMGPPPFGDGNDDGTTIAIHISDGFNGATAFRRWKFLIPYQGHFEGVLASMGPPPFGDGNET